jgi:hypothetical protein
MSSPLKVMAPAVGGRNLVSRLKNVVLPAPFGPDQRMDVAAPYFQVNVVDRDKALELLRQACCLQNDLGCQIALLSGACRESEC